MTFKINGVDYLKIKNNKNLLFCNKLHPNSFCLVKMNNFRTAGCMGNVCRYISMQLYHNIQCQLLNKYKHKHLGMPKNEFKRIQYMDSK